MSQEAEAGQGGSGLSQEAKAIQGGSRRSWRNKRKGQILGASRSSRSVLLTCMVDKGTMNLKSHLTPTSFKKENVLSNANDNDPGGGLNMRW